MCKTHSIYILNVRIAPDITGSYTCFTHNAGSSLVDYILVCSELYPFVDSFEVINFAESDHLPIACCINMNIENNVVNQTNTQQKTHNWERCVWKADKKMEYTYINTFQHPEAQNLIQTFENTVTNDPNEAVLVLESLLRFTGKKMQINRTYKHKSCTQPVWWNAECQMSKSAKYEKLSELRKNHSE